MLHASLGLVPSTRLSATCDEIAHLTAGASYWKTGDFRLVPEHPPLAEAWAALPVIGMQFPSLGQESWWTSNQWEVGDEFLYHLGNDAELMLFAGRSMIMVFSMALGLTVFLWSRKLFGTGAGLISLTLYCLSPTMLAHGSLITTDMASALFFVLSVSALWWFLNRMTPLRLLASVGAIGGLVLSKMSAPLFIPMAGLLVVVRLLNSDTLVVSAGRTLEINGRPGKLSAILAAALLHLLLLWAMIWAVYGLRYDAMREHVPGRDRLATYGSVSPYESSWDHELRNLSSGVGLLEWARDHRVLPESFLYGLVYTANSTSTRQAFLNGERSVTGFRLFFPYSFLIKSPLPTFAMLALAVWVIVRKLRDIQGNDAGIAALGNALYHTAPLWVLFCVYWIAAINSHITIGHRHLLPIYPVVFIAAGAAGMMGKYCVIRPRASAWMPIGLICLSLLAVLSVGLHYLAFFNTLVGGPRNGYKHLVNSSLDWGQGLILLNQWLDEHGYAGSGAQSDGELYVAYMGTASIAYHDVPGHEILSYPHFENMSPIAFRAGTYCISATALQQLYILPISRWTPALEEAYQRYISRVRTVQMAQKSTGATQAPEPGLEEHMILRLRFARLCALLRGRKPTADIGYSILVYSVTDQDIDQALFGPPPGIVPDKPETLLIFARKVAEAGDPLLASEFANRVLGMAPRYAEAHLLLGDVHVGAGRHIQALEHYRDAVAIDASSAPANSGLGLALSMTGRLEEAAAAYEKALKLEPRDVKSRNNLAVVLLSLGNPVEARLHCEKALEIRPRDPTLLLTHARVLVETGSYDDARKVLVSLLVEEPATPEAHALLASLLARQGDVDQAIAHYRESLRLAPGDLQARARLADLLRENQRYDEAMVEYELLFTFEPSPPPPWWADALLRYGIALRGTGRTAEADRQLKAALQLNPSLARVLRDRGIVLEEAPAGEPAADEPASALADAINMAREADRLAAVGRYEQAIELYRKALERAPDNALMHFNLAESLFASQQFDDARAHYQRAVELAPEFAGAWVNLGRTQVELGDTRAAIESCREAIRIQPDLLEAHYNLGTGLAHLGEYKASLEAMNKALEIAGTAGRADLVARIEERIRRIRAEAGETTP